MAATDQTQPNFEGVFWCVISFYFPINQQSNGELQLNSLNSGLFLEQISFNVLQIQISKERFVSAHRKRIRLLSLKTVVGLLSYFFTKIKVHISAY